ncbi:SDR family NAD(P)-dependent oxidoreductase, partial [Bacillus amyloliquefaciens]|uniref:SDR family NAD(P)-dependent oxidoreductase n=1 Tax=Bacillus amyloliquefaciens TaxID=1390 RepID=UPI0028479109
MDPLLKDKAAVGTGAARGIGFEIDQEFTREGAAVIIADVNEQAGKEAAAKLSEEGAHAKSITCYVTDEKQTADMIQKAVTEFGRLDIL